MWTWLMLQWHPFLWSCKSLAGIEFLDKLEKSARWWTSASYSLRLIISPSKKKQNLEGMESPNPRHPNNSWGLVFGWSVLGVQSYRTLGGMTGCRSGKASTRKIWHLDFIRPPSSGAIIATDLQRRLLGRKPGKAGVQGSSPVRPGTLNTQC